jgi:hypothetical protein
MFIGSKNVSICIDVQPSGAKWDQVSEAVGPPGCVGLACDSSGGYLSVSGEVRTCTERSYNVSGGVVGQLVKLVRIFALRQPLHP